MDPLKERLRLSLLLLSPELQVAAQYHFQAAGKGLRAQFAEACLMGLLPRNDIMTLSLAIELIHNGTLIQDDIQDGDTHRRGQETVWRTFDIATAMNLGTALYMLAQIEAAALNDANVHRLLAEALNDTISGQVLEPRLMQDPTWELYDTVCALKTGPLFRVALDLALLFGGEPALPANLDHPMMQLGQYFQMMDDLVDVYGDKGREVRGRDIDEGKITALVLALKDVVDGSTWDHVHTILQKKTRTQEERDTLLYLLDDNDIQSKVHIRARSLRAEIIDTCHRLSKPASEALHSLVRQVDLLLESTRSEP